MCVGKGYGVQAGEGGDYRCHVITTEYEFVRSLRLLLCTLFNRVRRRYVNTRNASFVR